jgi:transcriptional regulator with XRE-family HTH domain
MLREEKGMSQKEAAEALEMPRSTYVHYEDGSNEPKISVLIKISAYYDISVDWLIGNDGQKNSSPPEAKWEAVRKLLETLTNSELKEVYSYVKFIHWRRKPENQG